jgi:hypothetical protein
VPPYVKLRNESLIEVGGSAYEAMTASCANITKASGLNIFMRRGYPE